MRIQARRDIIRGVAIPAVLLAGILSVSCMAPEGAVGNLEGEAEGVSIYEAAFAGDVERVRYLAFGTPELVSQADDEGLAPLHWAALGGSADMIRTLAAMEADVDEITSNEEKVTPLRIAILFHGTELASALLNAGAKEDLFCNAALGKQDSIRTAIKADSKLLTNRDSLADFTLLHYAALNGQEGAVQLLISMGASVSSDSEGFYGIWGLPSVPGGTPLHVAAFRGYDHVVRLLLDNKAAVSATNSWGYTPLHLAAWGGDVNTIELLIQNGANPNARASDWFGYTPLHVACAYGNVSAVAALLKVNIDLASKTESGETPLSIAIESPTGMDHPPGSIRDIAKLLLQAGSNATTKNNRGFTPLHWLAWNAEGEIEIAKLLLKHGADVNALDSQGRSPLHWAAVGNDAKLVTWLLENGANPTIQDNKNRGLVPTEQQ